MFHLKPRTSFIIFLTGLCCVLANSVSNDQVECPQICPLLYAPICATDGKVYKEFSNPCELTASNCRLQRSALKPYTKIDMEWCSTTFVENLREKLGNLELTRPECMKPCPMNYDPVCVSNGKYRANVSNKCEMEIFNCALGFKDDIEKFKILKPSEC